MKCPRCANNAIESKTTFVSDLGDILIIIRNVPCYECEECGETLYTEEVFQNIENLVNAAKVLKQEISVLDYMKNVA